MNTPFFVSLIISITGTGLIIIGFILVQVRNQKKLLEKERQLAAAERQHQKELLEAVITSQETERQRIGSDLHDEVGTVLSSLRMLIEKHEPLQKELFHIQSKAMIDRVVKQVREIAHNLSPHINGEHGLHDAIHALCDTVNATGTIKVTTLFDESSVPKNLPEAIALSIYRVLAELINNTLKHAHASNITISIYSTRQQVEIIYTDDGVGFLPVATAGMGLHNIESRISITGGRYTLQSSLHNGMQLHIILPQEALNSNTSAI